MDDVDKSPGVVMCIFSESPAKASRLYAEDLYTDESAIMMRLDTKKRCTPAVEIHYNTSRHEHTPRGGGASEGCRPKLPRWPFSAPAAPILRAHTWMGYST